MQFLEVLLLKISNVVWGPLMLALLFGTHLFLTFRLKFIQKYIFRAIKISFTKTKGNESRDGEISHFGALATSLASTVGTGNIVGVATAVALGGPGAVFWLWITGVFGIATKYSEAVLSIKYRFIDTDGEVRGGPMYVLENGMKSKWLGIVFASMTAIAAFGIGNMVQANSISILLKDTLSIPQWVTGVTLAVLTAIIILGGIRSIARVCERIVPFMAIFYILGCVILLIMRLDTVPQTIMLIIKSAFTGRAAIGAFAGATLMQVMRYGIGRGLFSNESGMGSAPIVAAAAKTSDPVRQALVSASGTFWDTVVICALTGITLVNYGLWNTGLTGASLTKATFNSLPVIGPVILTVGMTFFVFSTIIGWSYYGEKAVEYLFGRREIKLYRWLWILAVMAGSVLSLSIVWTFADIANACMAVPNLISLIVLNGVIVRETKKYLWDKA